jgi:hypothetical protein
MTDYTIDGLKERFIRARRIAESSAIPIRLKGLHSEQARRALYFLELARVIVDLGLSNPFERSALSLEPTHPVTPSRLDRELEKLCGSIPGLKAAGMSLISLPMVADYAPSSEAATMFAKARIDASLCLLDHLYGFVYFYRDGRYQNHCLAIDFWNSRLETMPRQLAKDLWKNRADNLLSGGALSARFLFKNVVPQEPDARKRSEVPEIVVRSESHLLELVAALKEGASSLPNVQLWFRGQEADHQVPDRTQLLKSGLTPYSNIRESSLIPSIYRRFNDHLETFDQFELLLSELAAWVNAAKGLSPSDPALESQFEQQQRHARSTEGLTSFQRGLLLQQYGAPSAYLDITSDVITAAWFAVHHCDGDRDGTLRFTTNSWSGEDPATWPTIFVFPLVLGEHPFLDLSSILSGDEALRPKRQSCGLIGGAGNLARNYCARYVGLKLRLHPEFRIRKPVPATYLFPSDEEDPAMLHLRSLGLAERGRSFPLTNVSSV